MTSKINKTKARRSPSIRAERLMRIKEERCEAEVVRQRDRGYERRIGKRGITAGHVIN